MSKEPSNSATDLLVDAKRKQTLAAESMHWLSWTLSDRQLADLELLLNGSFWPLKGFLGRKDYDCVLQDLRLSDGTLWPVPIVLDVDEGFAKELTTGQAVVLRDREGVALAILHVEDVWRPDKAREAAALFGTDRLEHPGVFNLLHHTGSHYVGGRLEGLDLPTHHDFAQYRKTPAEVRKLLGQSRCVAVQSHGPLHRAQKEIISQTARELGANVLIHPSVGPNLTLGMDHFAQVRCYEALLPYFEEQVSLALMPLAARQAGPREELLHAMIRKNYGCTHLLLIDDQLSASSAALLKAHQKELGIEVRKVEELVYVPASKTYGPKAGVHTGEKTLSLASGQLPALLASGQSPPEWFSYPEVIAELRKVYRPRSEQGFTVFFTGLSGSGKSTLANGLAARLKMLGTRPLTSIDGDHARQLLSSKLGFSREDRVLNLRRIGYVAREVTRSGGIAVSAPIAPFDDIRKELRREIESVGGFILVHVSTSLKECERRDRKGLYAKARAGLIENFTGISSPYEAPEDADLVIDTEGKSKEECVQLIMDLLLEQGYIK